MYAQLPDFKAAHVLVFGDVMLDRYWHGPTSRISPEAPVPVVNIYDIENRAGGAGNVALNIATLGGAPVLASVIGEDDNGRCLNELLVQQGVDCVFHPSDSVPTITKLRVMSRHQQLIRLDFEQPQHHLNIDPLYELCKAKLAGCGAVILSDYGKGTLQNPSVLIEMARAQGCPVLVDPKGQDFTKYKGATLITPNFSEFEGAVGPCPDDDVLERKARELIDACELDALLITRSEKGMTLIERDQPPHHLPTHAREVFDVTGAGDTVISVLGAALAAGQPLKDAMALANTAAGIVVGKLGTASVTCDELRQARRELTHDGASVLNEDILLEQVKAAKAAGETLVMTNGCFDILHPGHVQYLREAKALGHRLLVAVNSDESVARLKGPSRPINTLEHRMAVLAGLESVDWVVPFSEDTPERLITRVLPDVLVKGGDYLVEQIAGHQAVQQSGGNVVILSFKDDCSTTHVVNTILASNSTHSGGETS